MSKHADDDEIELQVASPAQHAVTAALAGRLAVELKKRPARPEALVDVALVEAIEHLLRDEAKRDRRAAWRAAWFGDRVLWATVGASGMAVLMVVIVLVVFGVT